MEDLFSDYRETTPKRKTTVPKSQESIVISPEMFIGAVIVFIIAIVLAFSIGVEQGKRIAYFNPDKKASKELKESSVKQVKKVKKRQPHIKKYDTKITKKQKISSKTKPDLSKTTSQSNPSRKKQYAVQLIVYKDLKYAKKELEYLSTQKYPFFKEKKNGKIIIYAGPFSDKQEAQEAMKILRKRYKDCFVRLLKK